MDLYSRLITYSLIYKIRPKVCPRLRVLVHGWIHELRRIANETVSKNCNMSKTAAARYRADGLRRKQTSAGGLWGVALLGRDREYPILNSHSIASIAELKCSGKVGEPVRI